MLVDAVILKLLEGEEEATEALELDKAELNVEAALANLGKTITPHVKQHSSGFK